MCSPLIRMWNVEVSIMRHVQLLIGVLHLSTIISEYAEADCFYCFTALMSEIRDFFIKTLDESEGGIKQKMAKLSTMLKEKDVEVWTRLKDQELYPQYYSFRWLTLILSQEFPLPDVVRIWDSVFADEHRFDFLVRICCAMIV